MQRIQAAAPIFVQRTPEGELAKKIREVEAQLQSKYKAKIVEKCGTNSKDLLHKSNPLGGDTACPRSDCTSCKTEGFRAGPYTTVNVCYETICLTCKSNGKDTQYIGETHKSIYLKMKEHNNDYFNTNNRSHIRDHKESEHAEEEDLVNQFAIRILSSHTKPMERQLNETVQISNTKCNLLNKKDTYNHCRVPTMVTEGSKEPHRKNDDENRTSNTTKKRYNHTKNQILRKRRKIERAVQEEGTEPTCDVTKKQQSRNTENSQKHCSKSCPEPYNQSKCPHS